MSNYSRDELDAKALRRLLSAEQLAALADLIGQGSALLFDSVAGHGCWHAEFTDEERRLICQRIMVRMVAELFRPLQPAYSRSSTTLH
jgi:hypothetical protein